MADQYGHQLPDLGRLATGRTHFPVNQETPQPYFFNRSINNETVMLAAGEMVLPAAGGLVRFGHHHDFAAAATNHPTAVVDMESSGWGNTNESGNGRWPRQETLTLLEIDHWKKSTPRSIPIKELGPLLRDYQRLIARHL